MSKEKTQEEIERHARLKATNKTIKKLVKRYPNAFYKLGETNKKPLKENITTDIMCDNSAPLEYTFEEVNAALKRYQRLFSYHTALAKLDSMLHDLQGNEVGPASTAERARAHKEIIASKQNKRIGRLKAKLKYARGPTFVPHQLQPKKEKPKPEIVYDSHVWDKYLIEYKDFIKTTGWFPYHSPEAGEIERKLAGWANTQRKLNNAKKMSDRQSTQLNNIDFIWTLEAFDKKIWMRNYAKCEALIKRYRRLPNRAHPDEKPLNSWIKAQRRANREDRLSGEQSRMISKFPDYPISEKRATIAKEPEQRETQSDQALKSLLKRNPAVTNKGPTITIKKKRKIVIPERVEQ